MIPDILIGWGVLVVAFSAAWNWSRQHRNAGIVDVLWSSSLAALVIWFAFRAEGDIWRRVLLAGATTFWGLRLSWHVLARMRRDGDKEDGRYAALRNHWGERAERNLFFFFQGQAVASVLLALTVTVLLHNPHRLMFWDFIGLLLIVLAVLGEQAADRQLDRWKANPANRGRTCRTGLWKYSRHPNYFFEWLHWLAYPLMGLVLIPAGMGHLWFVTLLGPVVMLWVLLKGTGIPYTEIQALKSRGADYRRYQQEVSVFIPWFPKKQGESQLNGSEVKS